jgi:hypothetical protein
MGPLTEQVRDLYFRTVRGDEERYAAWTTPVYGDGDGAAPQQGDSA